MNPPQFLVSLVLAFAAQTTVASSLTARSAAGNACKDLAHTFPSLVAFPGTPQFASDTAHYELPEQNATCSIEPQTATDVGKILGALGKAKSPFAVKGGGHAYNVPFSSTSGVQISLAKFNTITRNVAAKTVTVGTGLTWGQVYANLEPMGLTVAGGRVPSVGVAGVSLGGGYSWKTQQNGLTVDTIVAYDVVLPSGKAVHATKDANADLFFGLKGGFNNFGVVTAITLETLPQTNVFAGMIIYPPNVLDLFTQAIADFDATNTDVKAQLLPGYTFTSGAVLGVLDFYYDGPTAPAAIYNPFANIPSIVNTVKSQTLVSFLNTDLGSSIIPFAGAPFRTAISGVPIVHYTVPVLNEMKNLTQSTGLAVAAQFGVQNVQLSVVAEPFIKPFSHSRGGAYPHPPSRQVTPCAPTLYVAAGAPGITSAFIDSTLKGLANKLQATAVQEGQSRWDDLHYPNYALPDTPLQLMYGANVPILKATAKKYDPKGVMKLTGGFKFQ